MEYIPSCEDEKRYLEAYNPDRWKKPSVTADIAVFAYENEKLYLLLVKRGNYPYKGYYALPGGFADMGEDLIDSAARELEEETGLKNIYLRQASMWGKPGRDPRDRTITALYMTLVDKSKVKPIAGDDAAEAKWFLISDLKKTQDIKDGVKEEEISLSLKCEGIELIPKITRKTAYREYKEFSEELLDRGNISFDHGQCIINAYLQLRDEIKRTDISYGVLKKEFSKEELCSLLKAALKEEFKEENIKDMSAFIKTDKGFALNI